MDTVLPLTHDLLTSADRGHRKYVHMVDKDMVGNTFLDILDKLGNGPHLLEYLHKLVVSNPGEKMNIIKWASTWQNLQNGMCAQGRLRSTWASAQSDQSLLSTWRKLGSLATHCVHSKDWSDWVDAHTDLSLRWVHMPFCKFCHALAQMWFHMWPFFTYFFSPK